MSSKQHKRLKGSAIALLLVASPYARAPNGIDRQEAPSGESQRETSDNAAAACPIRFAYRPIDFRLDSSETSQCHAPETMAGGVAVFDYNNDGRLDIFFANGADIQTLQKSSPKYSNRLFENEGNGHFVDVTDKAGLTGVGFDNGVAIADFDNDGFEDIFVGGVHRSTLYHNDGDGTFTDVTAKAGLKFIDTEYGPLWSVGAAWLDVNNDGWVDLFIVNYLKWDIERETPCEIDGHREYCHPKLYRPTPNQLFLNNHDGTFRDISKESGIRAHPGKGMGVGAADYDLDGNMDLFLSNDKGFNFLFHNKGGGRFEEVAIDADVALLENGLFISGMGVDFRDLDNDGLPDIALVALDMETFPIYRNLGKGNFKDVTNESGMTVLSRLMAGYSPTIVDFDNDGWKDLFVSRGHVQSVLSANRFSIEQHNTIFRNLGGIKFAAFTTEAGLASVRPARHRGSAVGDLNGDGRMDVVVSAIGAPAEIWINESPNTNHWLEFKLRGVKSNRDGIGARIKVVTKGGVQFNQMSTAAGYASSSAGPVHFGLRQDTSAETVEIQWPSGATTSLRDVPGDRVVTVIEPTE